MHKKILLTQKGLNELKEEHKQLIDVKRPKAVKRLAEAKAQGDLSENSEYTASMDELSFIDGRIAELEEILVHAQVAKSNAGKIQNVQVGCQVIVDIKGKEETFFIVGEWEADPMRKKISHSSPLGKALMGKKQGESIEVDAPAGKIAYKIVKIK